MISPSGMTQEAVQVQQALLIRLARVPLAQGMDNGPLRRAIADIVALTFDNLAAPAKMPTTLVALFKLMNADGACQAQCTAIKDVAHGNAQTWSTALLDLMAREQITPFALKEAPNTFGWTLVSCSPALTRQLVLSLARTGRKGTYRIGVAAGLRRPVNAMIDPLRHEWQKAGLSIEIRTGTIRPD